MYCELSRILIIPFRLILPRKAHLSTYLSSNPRQAKLCGSAHFQRLFSCCASAMISRRKLNKEMSNIIQRIDQTTIYTQPIFFVLILVTNSFNICILRSPVLRSSPCTYYFFSYSIFSIIYTCCLCPLQLLRRYSIPWTDTSVGCRVQDFLLFTLALQTKLILTFASFDRFCTSGKSIRLRSFSRLKTAKITIIVIALFSVFSMSPMLVIQYYDQHTKRCEQLLNGTAVVYIFGQMILYLVGIPSLMICFGFLTICNIRQKPSIAATLISCPRTRRSEGQLARMLLLQVGAHLIYTLPFSVTYIIRSFARFRKISVLFAIHQASIPWLQCDYFTFFFLYILSARLYRQEFFRLLNLLTPCHQSRRRTQQRHQYSIRWVSTASRATSQLDSDYHERVFTSSPSASRPI